MCKQGLILQRYHWMFTYVRLHIYLIKVPSHRLWHDKTISFVSPKHCTAIKNDQGLRWDNLANTKPLLFHSSVRGDMKYLEKKAIEDVHGWDVQGWDRATSSTQRMGWVSAHPWPQTVKPIYSGSVCSRQQKSFRWSRKEAGSQTWASNMLISMCQLCLDTAFEGGAFYFRVLLFGLLLAPRIFHHPLSGVPWALRQDLLLQLKGRI